MFEMVIVSDVSDDDSDYWCLQDTYCDLQACFQKLKICTDRITMNCNYHVFKTSRRDIVTSHTFMEMGICRHQ